MEEGQARLVKEEEVEDIRKGERRDHTQGRKIKKRLGIEKKELR